MTTQEKANMLIEEFAKDRDIVEFVERTENKIATTRGHYGEYMHFLTPYVGKEPIYIHVLSQALIKAGADSYGVEWAVKILRGE